MKFTTFKRLSHFGSCEGFPENTLEGIRCAIEKGMDGISIPVQRCQTGELIAFGDETLQRLTNGTGFVGCTPKEEIDKLSMNGFKIPLFSDVLNLLSEFSHLKQPKKLIVELKNVGVADEVSAMLSAKHLRSGGLFAGNIMVTSDDHTEILRFGDRNKHIDKAINMYGTPVDYALSATKVDAQCIIIRDGFVNPHLIRDAKARGIDVYVSRIQHNEQLPRLREMGVDGVTCINAA